MQKRGQDLMPENTAEIWRIDEDREMAGKKLLLDMFSW
jgi:hypothetical protein